MCELTGPFEKKSFTGYKIAVHELSTGKIRSSCMGFIYKPGKIPIIKNQRNLTCYWSDGILKSSLYYNKQMEGRTMVFVHKEDAAKLFDELSDMVVHLKYAVILLKMTITGDLLKGNYNHRDIIAGTHIKTIKIYDNDSWF
jgi:hypothetical protein